MFNLTKQEQVIILFLIGILLVGLGVKYYFSRQQNYEIIAPATTATDTSNRNANQPSSIVHIAGAVNKPGVYHLPAGSRIYDAITTAGDTTFQADISDLNLAAVIGDGDKIDIPILQNKPDPKPEPLTNEARQESFSSSEPISKTKTILHSRSAVQSSRKININTATVSELDNLPGIGPKLAERIILYRQQHGPFKRIDDIVLVSGIGSKRFEQMKSMITVK